MYIFQEEKNPFLEKQIKLLFPSHFSSKNNECLINQADFTEKCDTLSSQMALIFNFQQNLSDSYDELLQILDELLAMNSDSIVFPYNTFNSYSIPRILTILIEQFPNSDVYLKSFQLSEVLSRDALGARQFCNNGFIQLILQYLSSLFQVINDENQTIVLLLLRILSNIFSNTDDGMIEYCFPVLELLSESINEIQNEAIIDPILMVISNMLNYHQYYNQDYLLKIASFFIDYLDPNIQPPYSRVLYILHQIIYISKETIPIIINPTTLQILIGFTSHPSSKIRIATNLIFISFLKKSEAEYKEIIYDSLSWSWFDGVWKDSQNENQQFLIELFYYLIYYNEELLPAAVDEKIISDIFDSFENSPFSLRLTIVQNIIRTVLLGNTDFLLLLINDFGFMNIIDEFLSLYSNDILPFIISFYYYLLQLLSKGQITIQSLDLFKLNEQLSEINTSDLDLQITKNLKTIINTINSLNEE